MGFNRELQDFLRGWSGVNAIRDQYDDNSYRKLRNALAQEKLTQLQDPEERKLDRQLKRERANYLGAMSSRLRDPNYRGGASPTFDPAAIPTFGPPPQAPVPGADAAPAAPPASPPVRQGALDLGDFEDDEDLYGTQPTQFAAEGGKIEDTDKLVEGARAIGDQNPAIRTMERAHDRRKKAQAVPAYDGGGLVGDDEPEAVDNPQEETDEEDLAGSNPLRPQRYSYDAADDAVRAGLAYGQQAVTRLAQATPSAVPDPASQQRRRQAVTAYVSGKGAAQPQLMQAIFQRVDPKGEMSESQRNMAAYSAMWQFYMKQGRPDLAQKAAFGMLQYHRVNMMHYNALARAALDSGHLDTAAQFAAKSFANVPNGKDVKVTKQGDRLVYEAVDERTGKVVKKGILTPQEVGAWVMQSTPDKFDELVHSLAGKKMEKPPKPPKEPKFDRGPKLNDRKAAGEAVEGAYKGEDETPIDPTLRGVAAGIYAQNDIDPKSALDVANRMLSPKNKMLSQPKVMEDGSRLLELEDGRQIKVSRNTWLQAAAIRGTDASERLGGGGAQHEQNVKAGDELFAESRRNVSRSTKAKQEKEAVEEERRRFVPENKRRRETVSKINAAHDEEVDAAASKRRTAGAAYADEVTQRRERRPSQLPNPAPVDQNAYDEE